MWTENDFEADSESIYEWWKLFTILMALSDHAVQD